jgi:DNA-binding response OmpR family regulator
MTMEEKQKILIADDDPNVIRSLTFVLNKKGYDSQVATNGEEAILKIKASKPSLMLLDVMMPKKNGYEVCKEVKGDPMLSDIYVIMLTAKGQEADRQIGLSMGADEFVTKPFGIMDLADRVKQILG